MSDRVRDHARFGRMHDLVDPAEFTQCGWHFARRRPQLHQIAPASKVRRVQGPRVRSRTTGHQLEPGTDVLRFEVADLNRIITSSVAHADLYRSIQDGRGQPSDWQVLPLSCFAITKEWTPTRLAEGSGFTRYRLVRASVLATVGVELWPTEIFVDDVPDPRNEVHYDLIVAASPRLIPEGFTSPDKGVRRAARAQLAPRFEAVLALLGEPITIDPASPGPPEGTTIGPTEG